MCRLSPADHSAFFQGLRDAYAQIDVDCRRENVVRVAGGFVPGHLGGYNVAMLRASAAAVAPDNE